MPTLLFIVALRLSFMGHELGKKTEKAKTKKRKGQTISALAL